MKRLLTVVAAVALAPLSYARMVPVTMIMPASVHAQWQKNGTLPVEVATTFASKTAAIKKGNIPVGGFANQKYVRAQGQKFSTALLDNQKNGFLLALANPSAQEDRVVVRTKVDSAQLIDGAHINVAW